MIHATWRKTERLIIDSPDLPEPIEIEVMNLSTGGSLIAVDDRRGYRIVEKREEVEKRIGNSKLRGGLR